MMMIDMQATGRNIANMRKARGITIRDIQYKMGFNTNQAIYKWQRGDSMPTIDNLVILADMFHAKIDDIIIVTKF
jgi:transcriptional regulator with XRE-family HTH domain